MNKLRKKLNSQSGASITFALLLFLVCTVLSSVIIVAATASSGRMSKIAETDQKYYSVTSAAALLKDMFADPDKPISIVKVEVSDKKTKYNADGTVKENGVYSNPELKAVYLVDKAANLIQSEKDCSGETIIYGNGSTTQFDSIQKDAAYHIYNKDTTSVNRTFSMTSLVKEELKTDKDPLAVDVSEKIREDGSIVLQLSSNDDAPYVLTLTLFAERKEFVIIKEVDSEPDIESDGSYSVITTKTILNVTGLSWGFPNIKVGAAT